MSVRLSRFRHLETTPAVAKNCSRCGQPILTSVSDGLHVYVDPYPIDLATEMVAVLLNRQTYTYTIIGKCLVGRWNNTFLLGPVYAQHVCYVPLAR